MRLEGRAALVTGAASGIGRAVSVRFAEEGARIALLDKADEAVLKAVVGEIERAGGRAVSLVADVSDAAAVDAAVARAAQEIGPIDIAVNAAGIWYANPVTDGDIAAFRPHRRHQPEGHLLRLSGRGAGHDRSRRRTHRQLRLGGGRRSALRSPRPTRRARGA